MPADNMPTGIPRCPSCFRDLRVVRSARMGGARRYAELIVLECAQHGTVYHTREGLTGEGPDNGPGLDGPDGSGDRGGGDAPCPATRPSSPPSHSRYAAVPAPRSREGEDVDARGIWTKESSHEPNERRHARAVRPRAFLP